MKRWTELFDASDVVDTMEFILLLAEGSVRTFTSTTKGGLGKVWRVKENEEEYITVSSDVIDRMYVPYNRIPVVRYRHTVIKNEELDELERIIVEKRL